MQNINKLKYIALGVIAVVLLTLLAVMFVGRAGATFQLPQPPSYICHATPPDTAAQGYLKQSPSIPQLIGHIAQHDADIIPPFGQYGGKNWGEEGQGIWENDCVVPEPEDVCDNLEGIQEETPEGYQNNDGYCFIPEEPIDYCDTLEGVQAEDEDCPKEEEETPPTPPSPFNDGLSDGKNGAPVCTNGETINVVANPHVWRNGESATVNFFITEGDSANIFYSEVGQPHWQHAVSDVKPNSDKFVSYTIHGLDPNLGYDFGIQQKNGCGGGKTTAVVVDGPQDRLFILSYWE